VASVEGSWWPEWTKWLAAQSGEPSAPPRMGTEADERKNLADAPGDYVRR
jgi:polyhydroxyalkanoate synthase